MVRWKKLPPFEGTNHHGCLNCSPVEQIASPNMVIAVGFGCAMVTCGSKVIFMEAPNDENLHTLAEFEKMAQQDPNHSWQVALEAPLRGVVYQRHDADKWVLVKSTPGFA